MAHHINHFSHVNTVGTTFTPITEVSTEKRIKKTIFDDLVTRVNSVRASWNLGAVSSGAVVGAVAAAATWNAGVATPSTIYKNPMSVSDGVGNTGTVTSPTASTSSGTAIGTTIAAATAGVTKIQDTPYAATLTALGTKYCTSNSYSHSDHTSHTSHSSHTDHTSHGSTHASHGSTHGSHGSSHGSHGSSHGSHASHASLYST